MEIGLNLQTAHVPKARAAASAGGTRLGAADQKEIGEQSAMLVGFLGALKDAMGQAPGGAGTVEAPIAGYPNFEHLEAEGQRLLPEQLKEMLKAMADPTCCGTTRAEVGSAGTATSGSDHLSGVEASCRERLAPCKVSALNR